MEVGVVVWRWWYGGGSGGMEVELVVWRLNWWRGDGSGGMEDGVVEWRWECCKSFDPPHFHKNVTKIY